MPLSEEGNNLDSHMWQLCTHTLACPLTPRFQGSLSPPPDSSYGGLPPPSLCQTPLLTTCRFMAQHSAQPDSHTLELSSLNLCALTIGFPWCPWRQYLEQTWQKI